jgi:hypothetical protein
MTTRTITIAPVRKSIRVKASQAHAQGDEARLTRFFGLTANRLPPAHEEK